MTRPAPVLTDDNRAFWEAAAARRLVAERCRDCGAFRHPPRPMCAVCHSIEKDAVELSGIGVVYSYILIHYPQHPAFTYPVVAVLVDLEEGVRLVSNLVGVEPSDVYIGMPVQVTFAETAGEMAVPVFEPRTSAT
jgi:uncharacterized OB-fold protein